MCIITHSMQLVDQRPTRSPRRMPSDQRPRATRSAASLSSAQVMTPGLVARCDGKSIGKAAGGAVEELADGEVEEGAVFSARVTQGR